MHRAITQVLPMAAGAICTLALLPHAAFAQSGVVSDAKIAAYEQAIKALQDQIDQLKKEVDKVKEAQKKPAAPPASAAKPRTEVYGFIQSQYENTNGSNKSRFLLRRARIGVRGTLDNNFNYAFLNSFEDGANASNAGGPIRNAYIEYRGLGHSAHSPVLRMGQFKTGYSLEAVEDAAITPFIERAIAVEEMSVNHDRDMGFGFYTPENLNRPYAYTLNVMNGAGRNRPSASGTKMFSGRIQVNTTERHPFLGGSLALGFSTRQGAVTNLNRPAGSQNENERYGIDLEYKNAKLRFRGEYLWGRDAALHHEGFYALLGYRVTSPLEALFRYEGYTPDKSLPSVHRSSLGLTYHFSKVTEAYLNYEFIDGIAPSGQSSGFRLRLTTRFP